MDEEAWRNGSGEGEQKWSSAKLAEVIRHLSHSWEILMVGIKQDACSHGYGTGGASNVISA
jgi:hypothetical protein